MFVFPPLVVAPNVCFMVSVFGCGSEVTCLRPPRLEVVPKVVVVVVSAVGCGPEVVFVWLHHVDVVPKLSFCGFHNWLRLRSGIFVVSTVGGGSESCFF